MKRYNVSEGLFFEVPEVNECFWLSYLPDNASIPLLVGEIDRAIDALKRIKAQYEMRSLKGIEKERLAQWNSNHLNSNIGY